VEAADREQEARVGAPAHPQRHVAGEREAGELGVVERRVDGRFRAVEVDHAQRVDLQLDDRVLRVRQHRLQTAERDEPDRRRQLERERQVDRDQRGGAPQDPRRRSEHVPARGGREQLRQRGDGLRGALTRLRRAQNGAERARLQARAQPLDSDRAVDAEQAAGADEPEAQAELDRREVSRDQHEQREVWLGGDDADRSRADALERQVELADVLALGGVVREVAAARDRAGVDRQAKPVRALERDLDVRDAQVPGRGRELGADADAVDVDGHRSELDAQSRRHAVR
jgi:hypothetical protein